MSYRARITLSDNGLEDLMVDGFYSATTSSNGDLLVTILDEDGDEVPSYLIAEGQWRWVAVEREQA